MKKPEYQVKTYLEGAELAEWGTQLQAFGFKEGRRQERERILKIINKRHTYTKGCNCDVCEIIYNIKREIEKS